VRVAGVEELRDLFMRLAGIRSPSGEERELADFVTEYVSGLGLIVEEDASALGPLGSGNLLIRVPGRGEGLPVALCAHLDTVATERAPTVMCVNGIVRTDGETILGADDKAAVAVLLLLMRDLAVKPPAADVEILLTAREEIGLQGAKAFDIAALRAKVVFVFDSSGEPGSVIVSAPTHKMVAAEFRGVAAHAGMFPEDGRSAVLAAARAIVAMEQGRVDEQTTTNVGVVAGGTATNIVPERCTLRAEARSRDDAKAAALVERMLQAITLAAAETGVDVDIDVQEEYHGYRHGEDALPVRLAAAAIADTELTMTMLSGNGGSDGNIFNALGLPSLTLGVGYERVHSPQEQMRLDRLVQVSDLAHALVRAAGAMTS
jgi:tripeptide aminopeptidase